MSRVPEGEGLFYCHILTLEQLREWEFQLANILLLLAVNDLLEK